MNIHTLLYGMVFLCFVLGTVLILLLIAKSIEQKALKKWRKENSVPNFDIEN